MLIKYTRKSEILIYNTTSPEKLLHIVLHELGHALKLKHVEGEYYSVMRSGISSVGHTNEVSFFDIIALKEKWGD